MFETKSIKKGETEGSPASSASGLPSAVEMGNAVIGAIRSLDIKGRFDGFTETSEGRAIKHRPRSPFLSERTAYIALVSSWLVGVIYSEHIDLTGAALSLLLLAVLFVSRYPMAMREKGEELRMGKTGRVVSMVVLVLFAAATAVPLALSRPEILYILLPLIALLAMNYGFRSLRSRSIAFASILGYAGLALAAPLAMIAVQVHTHLIPSLRAWLIATMFYIGMALLNVIRMEGRIWPGIIYYSIAITGATIGIGLHFFPPSFIAVMLIGIVRLGFILRNVEKFQEELLSTFALEQSMLSILFLLFSVFHKLS